MDCLGVAERCEQATKPDRELDLDIATAVRKWTPPEWRGGSSERARQAKRFTASLDAALTLVPDGFDWILGRTNDGLTIHAEVGGRGGDFMRFGNTPALALCAAALRARAASVDTHAEHRDVEQARPVRVGSAVAATGGETPKEGPRMCLPGEE